MVWRFLYYSGNIWVPESIFGELWTSANYDDSDNRVTGDRNGHGAKLANVFKKRFTTPKQGEVRTIIVVTIIRTISILPSYYNDNN
jgi:hypothetical protein